MKTIDVLFVCNTNISLSPLAVACLNHHAKEVSLCSKLNTTSAGCFAGKKPRSIDRRIKNIAEKNTILLPTTTSTNICLSQIQDKELIIVMNDQNFWHIKNLSPSITSDTLKLFMEFSGQLGFHDMPDPLLGEISFDESFEIIRKVTDEILKVLRKSYNL